MSLATLERRGPGVAKRKARLRHKDAEEVPFELVARAFDVIVVRELITWA